MLWLSSLYIAIDPTNSIHFQFIKDAKILLNFFQFLKTYALKLAHLFTYYNYNYTLYTSQDCETIFIQPWWRNTIRGFFFCKSTHADKTNWQNS